MCVVFHRVCYTMPVFLKTTTYLKIVHHPQSLRHCLFVFTSQCACVVYTMCVCIHIICVVCVCVCVCVV